MANGGNGSKALERPTMTLQEFVDDILCAAKAVYIAIMPNSERWEYDLEVEVNHGTIGGVYATDCHTNKIGLRKVRKLANELDAILTTKGIKVFRTRAEWEEYYDFDDMLKPIGTGELKEPQ